MTGPIPSLRPQARRGPRRDGDTRADILVAARRLFAEKGYEGTSLRAVAREAGVDPALVHHYFDGKSELFAAGIGLEVDIAGVAAGVLGAGAAGVPAALVRTFLEVWEVEATRQQMLGVVANLVSRPEASRIWAEYLAGAVLGPVTRHLRVDQPERRTALVASQLIGLAIVRYVVRLEPLAHVDVEGAVADVAPVVGRYLFDPLP